VLAAAESTGAGREAKVCDQGDADGRQVMEGNWGGTRNRRGDDPARYSGAVCGIWGERIGEECAAGAGGEDREGAAQRTGGVVAGEDWGAEGGGIKQEGDCEGG